MRTEIEKQEKATARAIFAGGIFSDSDWRREAEAAVNLLIKRKRPFTTDDVLSMLKQIGVKTHDNRALGAVIRSFSRDDVRKIKAIGVRKATWRDAHRRPKTLWMPI